MPEIDISGSVLDELARSNADKGYTVPGVQKKLSLHLGKSDDRKYRLTLVDYPSGYILKPQTAEFECLPEAEQLVMDMAGAVGISTVPHALVLTGPEHEGISSDSFAYITRRIDRVLRLRGRTGLLAMEDFCQLSGRLTEDKYKGSYEQCFKIIEQYSSRPGLDKSELFLRLLFSFVTGNSDMHLKNFSLIETAPGSRDYILSPAYDMLPVNVIMPEDDEELALTLCGRKSRITWRNFCEIADRYGISGKTVEAMRRRIASSEDRFAEMCDASYMNEDMKASFKQLVHTRIQRIAG